MEADTINAWFTPFHYFVYLSTISVLLVAWLQWKWSSTTKNNIQVIVAQRGGGGEYVLAPKAGGTISIKNPRTNITRTWPVNELATIDLPYPGLGLIPSFLQKSIRTAVVSEDDWEPVLNRSPHRTRVMSPDVIQALQSIANKASLTTRQEISNLLEGVSTAPTREMIASPAVLGNLIQEKITELAVTVSKDIVNPINEAIKKMGKTLNPVIVYAGLGLIGVLLIYLFISTSGSLSSVQEELEQIKDTLGISP